MIEIIPLFWICSTNDLDSIFIKNKNVKNIINCSKMKKKDFREFGHNCETLDFPIYKNNLLKANFDIILDYIHRNMMSNILEDKSIVIYCLDGMRYSIFLALLYIIKYGNIERLKAIELLQSKLTPHNIMLSLDLDFDYFLKKYY